MWVEEGSPFALGSRRARVIEIPAHTRAHIAFAFEDDSAVFTGDTLFRWDAGACRRHARDDVAEPFQTHAAKRVHTRLLRPRIHARQRPLRAHPRTGNRDLVSRMREVEKLRAENAPTIPSTIGLEKRTNPFCAFNPTKSAAR